MITPYRFSTDGKKVQVAQMFNGIAKKYDFLNQLLSFGIDKMWRRKAISLLEEYSPKQILDVATGTGEFAIECLKLDPASIIGVDISEGMLKKGQEKINNIGVQNRIRMQLADSECLPFEQSNFDAITVAFGVRNFEHLEKGLCEFKRVLKSGGVACILEFSKPTNIFIKLFYGFYSSCILPIVGKIVSKDFSAYNYLPKSVKAFPDGNQFISILERCGFDDVEEYRLTFGVATIYMAKVI